MLTYISLYGTRNTLDSISVLPINCPTVDPAVRALGYSAVPDPISGYSDAHWSMVLIV